jgi:hypothetical protein
VPPGRRRWSGRRPHCWWFLVAKRLKPIKGLPPYWASLWQRAQEWDVTEEKVLILAIEATMDNQQREAVKE